MYYDDYLEHHGILGMKWGKKNGPPYPLSGEEHQSVTSNASPQAKAAAVERGGGEAVSLHTQNAGKTFDKEKAKKIAKNVAIGVGVAAAVGTAAYVGYQYHNMPPVLKSLVDEGIDIKVDELKAGAKASLAKAGKAMVAGALASAGGIAIGKIAGKIGPKEGDSELAKDSKTIAVDAIKSGINSITKSTGNKVKNGGNNKSNNGGTTSDGKVDRNSPEYQHLFDGLDNKADRDTIRDMAKEGATMEELRAKRDELGHSEIKEWADSFINSKFRW